MSKARNVDKWEASGRKIIQKHLNYDMHASELHEIMSKGNCTKEWFSLYYNCVDCAFYMGVAVGSALTKADQKKKQTA